MKPHQLPNATVGQAYSHTVTTSGLGDKDLEFADVKKSTVNGLSVSVDAEGMQISIYGMPETAGDYAVGFSCVYTRSPDKTLASTLRLTVNPDPKSLWKTLEPTNDQYVKPHVDSACISDADRSWKMAAASIRGRSHAHKAGFREDDFALHHCTQTDWKLLVVADGAGSADYSREGSRIAVDTAVSYLSEKLDAEFELMESEWFAMAPGDKNVSESEYVQSLSILFAECAGYAAGEIEREAKAKDCDVREYATTFLAVAVKRIGTRSLVASYWIGDGAVAAIGNNESTLMGKSDGGEYAGQTVFLDRQSIQKHSSTAFTCSMLDNLQSVIVMTDGVSDPRFETDSGLESTKKWMQLWSEIKPLLDKEKPDSELATWLEFWARGHHDDRTIALVWW